MIYATRPHRIYSTHGGACVVHSLAPFLQQAHTSIDLLSVAGLYLVLQVHCIIQAGIQPPPQDTKKTTNKMENGKYFCFTPTHTKACLGQVVSLY
jgi:hypothetical protein